MGGRAGLAGFALVAGLFAQVAGAATQTYRVGSCEVSPAPYSTIAAALTAAALVAPTSTASGGGHQIRVCPGTYALALSITQANHAGLTLVSTTGAASDVRISLYNAGSPLVTVGQSNVTLRAVKIENTSNSPALQVASTAS
jgi:hypothetical protein